MASLNEEKVVKIAGLFRQIMEELGLDTHNPSLEDTPRRVAKMYVQELFRGLDTSNKPVYKLFNNDKGYKDILLQRQISFVSCCEHHFAPIQGVAHVAYLPKDKLIGLSKINRLVQYIASKPQVQENLTQEIAQELQSALGTDSVAVLLEATHFCVCGRGVGDVGSRTHTRCFSGAFTEAAQQETLYNLLKTKTL